MNNDLRRWSDIKQTLLDYHNGLVMSKFLTEADCRNARFAVEGALYELELVPAVDAVEVVRCGQCLWRKEYDELGEQIWCMNPSMDCANLLRMDDFCSYGERKE